MHFQISDKQWSNNAVPFDTLKMKKECENGLETDLK